MPTATMSVKAPARAMKEPADTQMNTRINAALKAQGDAVLARNGLTPSQAVRSLWEYMAAHDDLPDYLKERQAKASEEERARRAAAVERASGFVGKFVVESGLMTREEWERQEGTMTPEEAEAHFNALKDEMWDEKLEKFHRQVRGGGNHG